jgi:NAD-dependent dihydropyrimidine dehydrogenase PreA subunit
MVNATTKLKRKIIKIDEEKCTGCGLCIVACAEGALKIIDGKAKLVSDVYCDGLGACMGKCPQDALTIEEREADEFDEVAVEHHLAARDKAHKDAPCACPSTKVHQFKKEEETLACGCPSSTVTQLEKPVKKTNGKEILKHQESELRHWPVQLRLVPPTAPFLQGVDLLLTADCVPFAYADFHRDFIKDHAVLVACPKLDDFDAHQAKLTQILSQADIKSITVARMEVPCCFGLVHLAKKAIEASGKNIPFKEVVISARGEKLEHR